MRTRLFLSGSVSAALTSVLSVHHQHYLCCKRGMHGTSVRRQHRGSDGQQQPRRGGGGRAQPPAKDRFPPKAFDPNNPKRNLAVLVDAQKVDADAFCSAIEPLLADIGSPVMIRVFEYDLNEKWNALVAGGLADASKDPHAPKRVCSGPSIEWFRVERFIPIAMQMAADANHIFELKNYNRVDGVCYVCTELERAHFESLVSRLRGRGFNQYVFDELGLGLEVNDDGRSKDGSPVVK